MSGMTDVPLTGHLLVATPALLDPNFRRTVILVLEHQDAGCLGIVLNRPTQTPLVDVVPQWQPLAADPGVVFLGGPVSPSGAIGLCAPPPVPGVADLAAGGLVATADLSRAPADNPPGLRGLRVFAGYAGWGEGQLEAEISAGAWYVVDAEPGDAFGAQPDQLWGAVLRRQPGALRLVATFPDDPSLN